MDVWSVTQKIIIISSRLLKKSWTKNRSSSNQCRSLHGFQTSLFMCKRFTCKLRLRSIQIHARDCFQVFALCHLKRLCNWSLTVWADDLYRTGRWFRSAALHKIVDSKYADLLLCLICTETNELSEDWAKWWARLWSKTSSCEIHRNYHFTRKKCHLIFFSNTMVVSSKGLVITQSSGPGHIPISRIPTLPTWHMVLHRLVLLCASLIGRFDSWFLADSADRICAHCESHMQQKHDHHNAIACSAECLDSNSILK